MTCDAPRILVIGYGNPGRRDDGLGPALAAALDGMALPGVTVDADYQLTIEHAAEIAAHDAVIFADAAVRGPAPFEFRRLDPGEPATFSTHSVSPAGVLALAQQCFAARTCGYVLALRGYEFNEFGEGLSPPAQANLAAAVEFLHTVLQDWRVSEIALPNMGDAFPVAVAAKKGAVV